MKISFECGEGSASLFLDMLNKLSGSNKVKIRIGGDEYDFNPDVDSVGNIMINDVSIDPVEAFRLRNLRETLLLLANTPNPSPAPIPNTAPVSITPTPSTDNSNTDDPNNDSDIAVLVRNVVDEKVAQNVIFTAYDITKELRTGGSDVRHYVVKPLVHDLFASGGMQGYSRTTQMVKGNVACVFHSLNDDPANYQG